jgi:hypothetical protein
VAEGLDLHLGMDKTAGFVERALETALPPPHAWSRALDALVEVVQGIHS